MKTLFTLLAASMFVATFPLAGASHPDCHRNVHAEGLVHPLKADTYLYVDAAAPGKVGEWSETNRVRGLQTSDCFAFGTYRFSADFRTVGLP